MSSSPFKREPAAALNPRPLLSERGFTLAELMIATALSIIMLGAAFHFFDDLESLTEVAGVMTEVNQSLRASVDLMSRDAYQAGAQIPIGGIPLPNGTGASPVRRPGPGTNFFPVASDGGVLPAITPGYQFSGTIDGKISDEITMTMVDVAWAQQAPMAIASITNAPAPSSGYIVIVAAGINIASGPYQVNIGDFYMFSTPGGLSALGLVTGVVPTTNTIEFEADALDLNQQCGGTSGCGGTIDSLEQSGAYPAGMALVKVDVVSYYLDNTNAANPYQLMRILGNNTPNPVAYGINWLQVTYDLSSGATNQTDTTSPNQIRKVNLALSGISQQKLRKSQQFFGNTMATSVTIRNLEYVNQFP